MKLAVLNPNTSAAMTDAVTEALRARLPPTATLVGMTASKGVPVIDSAERFAVGAATALQMLDDVPSDASAILLACFGDPGLVGLRQRARVPVIGMAEATAMAAQQAGHRLAIVTAGAAWVPLLSQAVRALVPRLTLTGVYALPGNGSDLRRSPEDFRAGVATLSRQAADDGATALTLGGAAFAGLDFDIDPRLARIDTMDAVAAAWMAINALRTG
ncbi:hypothetical protein BH10PSE18_BH10PSE18_40280 [soil metagenome]